MMIIKTARKELLSVGVDIGSSTSHVVFSKIVLEKDMESRTEKFNITERQVLFSGPIHFTPFSDPTTIDFDSLRDLILKDYETAGYSVDDIDTGAVIITGETAKKHNAEDIVSSLAGEAGKFVSATAGPNFEAVLAAYGSGAVAKSEQTGLTIMNVDIGGGSSNIAVCKDGRVLTTAAINVGGRLVSTDDTGKIVRLEETGKHLAKEIGLEISLGDMLEDEDKDRLANALAVSLIDAIQKKNESGITKMLMMTDPLEDIGAVHSLTFSGGVAEYIYGRENTDYGDLGLKLAKSMKELVTNIQMELVEPEHRIRATVIGAGQFNLQVSGSTTFLSEGLEYPMRNLPVVVPHVNRGSKTTGEISKAIRMAMKRFDLVEGEDRVILSFHNAVRPSYESLTRFAKGVVDALPRTIEREQPIMMCFDADIGNSVGNVMRRETEIGNMILSIDEVLLEEGDFVDIGEPIIEGVVVPVVVKTLVFDKK